MCTLLDLVRPEAVLVVHDRVVRRTHGALQACMRLKVKVEAEALGGFVSMSANSTDEQGRWLGLHFGDAFIYDCARSSVPVPICVSPVGGEESRMVTLPTDDDGQFRSIGWRSFLRVKPLECFKDFGKFFVDDLVKLALLIKLIDWLSNAAGWLTSDTPSR